MVAAECNLEGFRYSAIVNAFRRFGESLLNLIMRTGFTGIRSSSNAVRNIEEVSVRIFLLELVTGTGCRSLNPHRSAWRASFGIPDAPVALRCRPRPRRLSDTACLTYRA